MTATAVKTTLNSTNPRQAATRQRISHSWAPAEKARRRELAALMLQRLGDVLGVVGK